MSIAERHAWAHPKSFQQLKEEREAKAAEEESAVAAKKAQAQKDLEQFYAERDAKVKARVAVNREEEKQYVAERDATVQEDSWESVAKMVNLKEVAGADTTRMRNVLIGLKHK